MEIDDLKKTIEKLSGEKAQLYARIKEKDEEIEEIVTNAGIVIIDIVSDFRILNSSGAIDFVFAENASSLKQGGNFIKLIYKLTKSMKERVLDKGKSEEEIPDLEKAMLIFLEGKKEERDFEVIGERENGELFLLNWKVRKTEKFVRNYLRITLSNSIIESAQEHHIKTLEFKDQLLRRIISSMDDGISHIDKKGKIIFLNDVAKSTFLSAGSEVMKKATIEGKFFREMFISEDNETLNERFSHIESAINKKAPVKFVLTTKDRNVDYNVIPLLDISGIYDGMIIITKLILTNVTNQNVTKFDTGKIASTIKALMDDRKDLGERLQELENNQKWFMKKMTDNQDMAKKYQDTIKTLYSYLEHLPLPISILELPSKQYQFVNKAFESLISKNRNEIKGKTDNDLYSQEVASLLYEKLKESVASKMQLYIEIGELKVRQFVIFNENNAPLHLIRIFIN